MKQFLKYPFRSNEPQFLQLSLFGFWWFVHPAPLSTFGSLPHCLQSLGCSFSNEIINIGDRKTRGVNTAGGGLWPLIKTSTGVQKKFLSYNYHLYYTFNEWNIRRWDVIDCSRAVLLEALQLFPGKLYSASAVQDINLDWGWCVSSSTIKATVEYSCNLWCSAKVSPGLWERGSSSQHQFIWEFLPG